ncbi:MAG: hypothetical protein IH921_14485 [Gemmatimonadetes bacterium]|nr:hypothetical protein [Gemmatimonadota bacterium]
MSDPVIRLNVALKGRYRIERELGEGGMATVYLGFATRVARPLPVECGKSREPVARIGRVVPCPTL